VLPISHQCLAAPARPYNNSKPSKIISKLSPPFKKTWEGEEGELPVETAEDDHQQCGQATANMMMTSSSTSTQKACKMAVLMSTLE
jgi:hypothetical protein